MEPFSNEWMTVTRAPGSNLVRFVRSDVRVRELGTLARMADDLERLVPLRERTSLVLLQDLRPAPHRTDAAFDEEMRAAARRMLDGWLRHALLVRTAIGKLQLARVEREGAAVVNVFDQEEQALAYLRGDAESHRRR